MKQDSVKDAANHMRAMREARARELAEQTGPAAEARRREAAVLKNLTAARDDMLWLLEHDGWKYLGFVSFGDWFDTKARPIMAVLGAKLQPAVAARVLDQIRAEEAELPRAQRRTQRELAATVGTSEWTVAGRKHQDRPQPSGSARADLETPAEQASEMPINKPRVPKQRAAEPKPEPIIIDAEVVEPQPNDPISPDAFHPALRVEDPDPWPDSPERCPNCGYVIKERA